MSPQDIELTPRQAQALKAIRNWFVHYGRGISVRELTKEMGLGSTRTAAILLNFLIEKELLSRRENGELRINKNTTDNVSNARTIDVPLVGTVSCGTPLFAEENVEAYYPISTSLAKPGSRYFLLRATGDSMNRAGIDDGDLVLVRQQPGAEGGDRVVALIDDEATVKEIDFSKDVAILKPRSTNKAHKPIVLNRDFQVQGVVVATLPKEALKS